MRAAVSGVVECGKWGVCMLEARASTLLRAAGVFHIWQVMSALQECGKSRLRTQFCPRCWGLQVPPRWLGAAGGVPHLLGRWCLARARKVGLPEAVLSALANFFFFLAKLCPVFAFVGRAGLPGHSWYVCDLERPEVWAAYKASNSVADDSRDITDRLRPGRSQLGKPVRFRGGRGVRIKSSRAVCSAAMRRGGGALVLFACCALFPGLPVSLAAA